MIYYTSIILSNAIKPKPLKTFTNKHLSSISLGYKLNETHAKESTLGNAIHVSS